MNNVELNVNVCECYNEVTGSVVNVYCDESGIYFNLNDILKIFRMGYKNKKWICDMAIKIGEEIKNITFMRYDEIKGGQTTEIFIGERMMYRVIEFNKIDLENEELFIRNIIQDYDTNVCENYDEAPYSTEQRLALERIDTRYNKFLEDSKEDFEILDENPVWNKAYEGDYLGSFIEKQLQMCNMSYSNIKCPEELRQEEKEKEMEERRKEREIYEAKLRKFKPSVITDGDLDAIYNVIYREEE